MDHSESGALAPRLLSANGGHDIASGRSTLGVGATGDLTRRIQWTLFSLGYDNFVGLPDGQFGSKTQAAIKAFQVGVGLAESGLVDRDTLGQLEERARQRVLELRWRSPAPAEKVQRYRLAVDMVACRICVLDRQTDAPVALYLTSPGSAEHPTHGDHFTIRATFVMSAWNPPPSPWAAHLKPVAGGVDNPMGLCKLDLGAHTQYIHGIPKEEEPELGSAASHGCLRMSGANILEMHELYAGAGTDVTLIRDPTQCTALLARFRSAGIAERSIEEGRCYVAPYLYSEIGFNEHLGADGAIKVGGRG